MKSYQTFRIVRASEEPPLTAKELRDMVWIGRRVSSAWEVVELEDAEKGTSKIMNATDAIKKLTSDRPCNRFPDENKNEV